MDKSIARIILSNLLERIEADRDGKLRLEGVITDKEFSALNFLVQEELEDTVTQPDSSEPFVDEAKTVKAEILNLSTLDLSESNKSTRVCLDFGTAMSKATLVSTENDRDLEEIHVLKLGLPGDQEQIDEMMLVSSLFIDEEGLIWFGQKAVEREAISSNDKIKRLDNIKRWLSEGNLGSTVDKIYNPTSYDLDYEHILLAYLTFFTWTVNESLKEISSDISVPKNVIRRFAMPCFPRANSLSVSKKLKRLLGESQVLADTYGDSIHEGISLESFLETTKRLRSENHDYSFIEGSITEPLGVAGSQFSWRHSYDSIMLVVDVGAGTSDFSLYRIKVELDEDDEIIEERTIALEIDGSARGITEAGNHIDKILTGYILGKAGISTENPMFINIAYDLDRNIRDYKETLFNTGAVLIVLYDGSSLDITLDEFLQQPAVQNFEQALYDTMVEILESVDDEFINWIRVNPSRRLVIALTGGGAALPMAQQLVSKPVLVNGSTVEVAQAKPFPQWLQDDYPDIEDHYARIAVSLGGARKNIIKPMGVLKSTASGIGGHQLERVPTRGN